MNIYVFWILFFGLWGIVPLMILKGRTDDKTNINTVLEVKAKKTGWFKQKNFQNNLRYISSIQQKLIEHQ